MENKTIYLTYYQIMIFMIRLEEMRNSNPYFNDEISINFENYVTERTEKISATYPQIKLKLIPNANKYSISKSMFNYLSALTGIDPLDEKTLKEYIPIITTIEEKAKIKFEEDFKKR